MLYGLTIGASPAKWNGDSSKQVTFKVRDADPNVKGAA